MEKLIKLLNEYDSNWGFTDYGSLFNSMNEGISGTEDLQVISKKFGFIKWLVDNDKIDRDKYLTAKSRAIIGTLGVMNNKEWDDYTKCSNELVYESLLMQLSVQDNPINFLCEILK